MAGGGRLKERHRHGALTTRVWITGISAGGKNWWGFPGRLAHFKILSHLHIPKG